MKKINGLLVALMTVLALGWTSCTDSVDYTAAGPVEGEGIYFPTSVATSYTLDGTSGEITLDVMRSTSVGDVVASLEATFTEGGENVFTVPSTVSFADGSSTSSLTLAYDNLVRGTTYQVTLTFSDGTPYSNSSLTLSFLYPEEVVYTWEVVSEKAILTESVFSIIGMANVQTTGITVEKAKEGELYRFRSPFNNDYFRAAFGGNVFADDSDLPYIVIDGETYKDATGKSLYYIAPTALGFTFTVDGSQIYIDTEDTTTETFGSIACNLSVGGSPVPPTSKEYPLGSYDANKKVLTLGALYLNVLNYSIMPITTTTTLALDPALLEADYDRDYTWKDLPEATGFFTSELMGESWMQAVQQSNEDATFYRMPNLYSNEEKAHIYFHIDMETGVVTIPRGQKTTGLTSFGNTVYLEGTPNKSSYDLDTEKLTLGFTFYLADKDGRKIAELKQVIETFLWGQSEIDQLQKNVPIEKYAGTWGVEFYDGNEYLSSLPITVAVKDASTLTVKGLSAMNGYDDTMELLYDETTGLLRFNYQELASYQGYPTMIAVYNSADQSLSDEGLIGGLTKDGKLKFLNDESNQGVYDGMIYLVVVDGELYMLSGYWNTLTWIPATQGSTRSFSTDWNTSIDFSANKTVKFGFEPRRIYNTELNIRPVPVKHNVATSRQIKIADDWKTVASDFTLNCK